MEFTPSENSVTINPITGKTMLGKYIYRNIIFNNPKDDEIAYINRMKSFYKDSGRPIPDISEITSYETLKSIPDPKPGYPRNTRNMMKIERARKYNKLHNSGSTLRRNNSPLKLQISTSVDNSMKIENEFRSNSIEPNIENLKNYRYNLAKRNKMSSNGVQHEIKDFRNNTLTYDDMLAEEVNHSGSLLKEDIEGASPMKFKHRYK